MFGEPGIHCKSAWDYSDEWHHSVNSDQLLCGFAHEILSSADAVVTHNGRAFDWKFLQTRFLFHGLPPLPRIPHIDTKCLAKTNLFLFNNKLNTLGKELVQMEKRDHEGWDLWVKVSERNQRAQSEMSKYCEQDVRLLLKIYKILRPFTTQIPNYNILRGSKELICPSCGGTRLKSNGYRYTRTMSYKRYICMDCRSWMRTDANEKTMRAI